jgi:serine/threonine protein kinase/WD40 repeat protein
MANPGEVGGASGAPAAADPLVGRTLGEFVVRERIGEGGFGAVYLAEQPALRREAVIKVLHERHGGGANADRFLREARLASKFDHPYAAHVYAFGAEPDGELWIAMELVRGTPLDQLLRGQGPLTLERFVPLFDKICEVVQTAHDQGIVHRDLKPANVMVLSRAGRLLPKLLDFGIAKGLVGDEPLVPSAERRVTGPLPAAPAPRVTGPVPIVPAASAKGVATVELGPGFRSAVTAEFGAVAADVEEPPARPSTPQLEASVSGGWRSSPSLSSSSGALTQEGVAMGSPPYMAPEQWMDASSVDGRTDLYALGIVAYEALTGRPPFRGKTITDIAKAHASQPVPPLGKGLPVALDVVLAKAMAKEPEDRYPTALELIAAFRAAAGLGGDDGVALPQLEATARDEALAAAPQPVAEAVAAVEAARNVHQGRDALRQLVHTVVRYLGLLTLACRSRTSHAKEGPEIGEALRTLYRRPLSDGEWVELMGAVTGGWVTRRDAFPIPELVDGFHGEAAKVRGLLDELTGLDEVSGGAADGAAMLHLLGRGVGWASALLRELGFLAQYPLVVTGGGGLGERWMGVRRGQRTSLLVHGKRLEPGLAVLLDPDGVPLLTLGPLIQAAAPAPGVPVELFLFEGRSKRGAKLVALPLGFEQHDDAVWAWFRKQLPEGVEVGEAKEVEERAPYRGLATFSADDGALFVGREKLVDAFVNRLRVQPLLTVVGRSGAGKSSFVQAGVVPVLGAEWRTVIARPGAAPLAVLEARLGQAGLAVEGLARRMREDPGALGELLRADAARRGPLLLVVDQLEELLTLCGDEAEREVYAAGLVAAARTAEDPVRVIATLRDDFLVRAEQLEALRNRLGTSLQLLAVPQAEDLKRILVEPARRAGYEFEDAKLPEEMVREVAEKPGALALLSFTAAKLWELRDRHFKQLTRKAYQSLGGVGGALAQHAEQTLAEMTAEEQRLTREAFRHLVTTQGTRAVLARRELGQLLGGGAHAEAVIEKLVAARLLVASENEVGAETVEVVHEALLVAWPRLVTWRREDSEGARLREQLRGAAAQWIERGRPRGLLWRDEALADFVRWRARHPGPLTDDEREFGEASVRDAARGRRLRRGMLVTAFAILTFGVIFLLSLNSRKEAERERAAEAQLRAEAERRNAANAQRHAEASEQTALLEKARQIFLSGAYEQAAGALLAARAAGASSPEFNYLLNRTFHVLEDFRFNLANHGNAIWAARFVKSGRQIVTYTEDGEIDVADARSGQEIARFPTKKGVLTSFDVDPAERRAVHGTEDGLVIVTDLETGKVRYLTGHTGRVRAARFSPDGRTIATSSADASTRLWDAESGVQLGRLSHGGPGAAIWFASDSLSVFTVSDDLKLIKWSARTGVKLREIDPAASPRRGVVGSPDGRWVVTGMKNRYKMWNASTGSLVREFVMDSSIDNSSSGSKRKAVPVFSAEGKFFASFTSNEVDVWRMSDGVRVQILQIPSEISGIRFLSHGDLLTTLTAQGVQLWDVTSAQVVMSIPASHGVPRWIESAQAGGNLVVGYDLTTAQVWETAGVGEHRIVGDMGELINSISISNDGMRLAACGEKGGVSTWGIGATPSSGRWSTGSYCVVALGANGTEALTGDAAGTLVRWDVASRTPIAHASVEGAISAVAIGKATIMAGSAEAAGVSVFGLDGSRKNAVLGGKTPSTAVALSAEGAVAACDQDGLVTVWQLSRTVTTKLTGYCGAIAWDSSGRTLGVATQNEVRLLRPNLIDGSFAVVASLEGHLELVSGVAFIDQDLVATSSWDASVRIWEARSGHLLEVIGANAWVPGIGVAGDHLAYGAGASVHVWRLPPRLDEVRINAVAARLGLLRGVPNAPNAQ